MIRLLVERGANPQKAIGPHDIHNLMDEAVARSDAEVGDLLRHYGLDHGPREMAAFNRLDELKHAIQQDPRLLKERFRPLYDETPGQRPTLLRIAIERDYREMVKFLIDSGATLDTIEIYGQTLLHIACRGGGPELIQMLVARGLDVNARDEDNETPLTYLADHGHPESARLLITAGADVNARSYNGDTALHCAAANNRTEMVRILLAAGADPTIPNRWGETVLDWATVPPSGRQRKNVPSGFSFPNLTSQVAELVKQAASSKRGVGKPGHEGKDGKAKSPVYGSTPR